MDIISMLIIGSSVAVGWCIGANSASDIISMLIGPHIASLRASVTLVVAFMLAGALLQSDAVMKTVGEGIVSSEVLQSDRLAALSVLVSTAALILVMTKEALPVSSSHAVIGALAGSSIALKMTSDLEMDVLAKIVASWFLTPVISLVLAYLIYKSIIVPLSKRISLVSFGATFKCLAVLATAFAAYGLGANNIGNSISLVISSGAYTDKASLVLAAVTAMAVGTATYSRNVVRNISRNITLIDPPMAFTVLLTSGLVVYFFTGMGVPISITQALIGGLTGIGITKGAGMVNNRLVSEIFLGWVLTPCIAGLLSIGVYEVLILFLGA